jgi:hypothetical protein
VDEVVNKREGSGGEPVPVQEALFAVLDRARALLLELLARRREVRRPLAALQGDEEQRSKTESNPRTSGSRKQGWGSGLAHLVAGLAVLRIVDPATNHPDPRGRVALLDLALRRWYNLQRLRLQRRAQPLQAATLRRRRHRNPPPSSRKEEGGNLAHRSTQIGNEMESGILLWCEPACGWGILPLLGTLSLSVRQRFNESVFGSAPGSGRRDGSSAAPHRKVNADAT